MPSIYQQLISRKQSGEKSFAILLDPDKIDQSAIPALCSTAQKAHTDFILVGGSLMVSDQLDQLVGKIKSECPIPVVLFPGSPSQLTPQADALLYLSLISGRNPELLIGQHVLSAPAVHKSGLEILSTGYMVVDGGAPTTVSYISHAAPIPHDKKDIAVCTAMAGEMLGMKLLYLDAGSGARQPVSVAMINAVSNHTQLPLIVGGGIRTPEDAHAAAAAGADLIVVGNALEKDMSLLPVLSAAVHAAGSGNNLNAAT
jgi:putative glycerol-1-phosphate prenyltransferase